MMVAVLGYSHSLLPMLSKKFSLSKKFARMAYSFPQKHYLSHEWVFPTWATQEIPNGVPLKVDLLVDALRNPYCYKRVGASVPRGMLLYGPPGTGKTLMMRTLANSLNIPFEYASATQFMSQYYGANKLVREFFQKALQNLHGRKNKKVNHVMMFIDEIELIGMRRDNSFSKGTREQLTELLVQLDGFEKNEQVVLIGATNRPGDIDEALLRRIPHHLYMPLPHEQGRVAILAHYLKKVVFSGSIQNIKKIAHATENYSGDDLAKLVNNAAVLAAYKRMDAVTEDLFWEILGEKKVIHEDLSKYMI